MHNRSKAIYAASLCLAACLAAIFTSSSQKEIELVKIDKQKNKPALVQEEENINSTKEIEEIYLEEESSTKKELFSASEEENQISNTTYQISDSIEVSRQPYADLLEKLENNEIQYSEEEKIESLGQYLDTVANGYNFDNKNEGHYQNDYSPGHENYSRAAANNNESAETRE